MVDVKTMMMLKLTRQPIMLHNHSIPMKPSDALGALEKKRFTDEAQFLHQLLRCSHFIERGMNTILRQFDLKQQQFAILNEIVQNGPISQKELAENLLYEKSNISRIIKILSEKKLIQITAATENRRLTLLIETAEGEWLWKRCMREFNMLSGQYLLELSKEKVNTTCALFRVLGKSLQSQRKTL